MEAMKNCGARKRLTRTPVSLEGMRTCGKFEHQNKEESP
jgi:hypothetical protein